MTSLAGLFPTLLAERWNTLPACVRALHGSESDITAHGRVDVRGNPGFVARGLRFLFAMPAPRTDAALQVRITRNGLDEIWRRDFSGRRMTSHLRAAQGQQGAFVERLGPVAFVFEPMPTGSGLRWITREARLLGVRVPLTWFSGIEAGCEEADGRYRFDIEVRVPLLGMLVAYVGWLEVSDDE